MTKEQLFRQLYTNFVKRDDYIDAIPSDIRDAFFGNEYVNLLAMDYDRLLDLAFGEHSEAVCWFLYEWKPGMQVNTNYETIVINNIDDYIDLMKRFENFS